MELLMFAGIIVYLISHFIAKSKNTAIARSWMRVTLPIWEHNFSHVGDDKGHKLLRDGPRDFLLYASGRVHVTSLYGFLHLKARYDVYQRLTDLIWSNNSYDKLTLTFTLKSSESHPFVFAVLARNLATTLVNSRFDLKEFCRSRDASLPNFPKSDYTVLTDAPEFATLLWEDPAIRDLLVAGGLSDVPRIESIVLTDLPKEKPTKLQELENIPKTLTVTMRLPDLNNLKPQSIQTITAATETIMTLIDYIGQKGTFPAERKADLANKKFAEKKEKEDNLTKLSPEEQRKYEERERRKEMKRAAKKKMKKGKIVM
ncbi:hypothetical protein BC832DRAFT_528230 [Gaertneriomyces semiglobifer]|nr:hypothetical protein BC832DRAFT_528230 [Gaertneriomyces semiglobifer]